MKTTALVLVSALFATAAHAADPISYEDVAPVAPISGGSVEAPAPVSAASHDWSGFYLGANGGWAGAKFKNTATYTDLDTNESDSISVSSSRSGFIGGVQAGYNWQIDSVVAGVETDFQGGTLKKERYLLEGDAVDPTSLKIKNSLDWFGTTRARFGYTVSPNALVYATGGAAYGKVKSSLEASDGVDAASIGKSKNKLGYAVGAGTEIGLTDDISFKTEYLYTDLGKAKGFDYTNADLGESLRGETKLNYHTVRLGVNYKF